MVVYDCPCLSNKQCVHLSGMHATPIQSVVFGSKLANAIAVAKKYRARSLWRLIMNVIDVIDANESLARDSFVANDVHPKMFKYCYYEGGYGQILDPREIGHGSLIDLLTGMPFWYPMSEHQAVYLRAGADAIYMRGPPRSCNVCYEFAYKGLNEGLVHVFVKETKNGKSPIEGLVLLVMESHREHWVLEGHWSHAVPGCSARIVDELASTFREEHAIDIEETLDQHTTVQDIIDKLKRDRMRKWSSHYFYNSKMRSDGPLRGFETRKAIDKLIEDR